MTEPNLQFSRQEYTERLNKTRAAMEQAELDLLVISDPSNMAWLSGYDGWSFYTHQALLVNHSDEPVWWGRGMDAMGAKRTVTMSHNNIIGYEDTYVQNPHKHPMETLATLVKDRGFEKVRIGVELDNYYYSAAAHHSLTTGLPNASFTDATGLVNWQRAIKSDTEITYMRRAARIVEEMHRVVAETAKPGVRKNDLIATIYKTAIEGVDGHWGDYPAIVPMAPSGMDATAPHLTWDDQPLKQGECTFFEIAGVHRHYHCPQSRTIYLGQPPRKYQDAEKAVLEAIEAGLAVAKPGNLCEDIAIAFNTTLNKLGFEKDSRCGYAIGLSYPPDWGERTMSFRAGDKSVLQPGMTFHFMPALWLDDGGLEITEPILITETGVDCLCNTPRQMTIID